HRNDRRRCFEFRKNTWAGSSRHTNDALDWLANPLVGTKKIVATPGVVHAWCRSYLQPWTGHQPAGALACHICMLFCPICGDLRHEAIRASAASGNCYSPWARARLSWLAGSSSAAVLCFRLAARCIDGTKGAPEVEQTRSS